MISYESIKLMKETNIILWCRTKFETVNVYATQPWTHSWGDRDVFILDLLLAITNFRPVLQLAWFFRIILSLPEMGFNALKPSFLLLSHPLSLPSSCVSIGNEVVNKMFINVSCPASKFFPGKVTHRIMKFWYNYDLIFKLCRPNSFHAFRLVRE